MEVCLGYLTDPRFQTGAGHDVGVEQSTLIKNLFRNVNWNSQKSKRMYKIPNYCRENKLNEGRMKCKLSYTHGFRRIGFYQFFINTPSVFGVEYINRNGKASINVQENCNALER